MKLEEPSYIKGANYLGEETRKMPQAKKSIPETIPNIPQSKKI
jgi:hypothetical protein